MFCSSTQGISSKDTISSYEVDSENRVSEPQVSSFQDSQLEPLSPQTLLTDQPLTSAQCASLCPFSCGSCALHQDAFRDQSLIDRKDAQLWRRNSPKLDGSSDQSQTFGVEGRTWGPTEARVEGQDGRPQQSGQEEGRSPRVCLQAGNMTIAQIYALAEQKITLEVVPTGNDKMNFGQYRDLTYEEVMIQHPSYVVWAQKMVAEGDVCWRLARWIQWVNLETQKPKSPQPTARSKMNLTPQRGYTTARGSPSKDLQGDSSDTSFSLVEQEQQHEIEVLKLELARVKQEKLELESTVGPTKLRREM